jgi:hypothetical protein
MKLSFTTNLIQLEKKISIENYPNIVYQDDIKNIKIHESDVYLTLLNRSWMNVGNSDLKDFLKTIIDDKFSFCPSTFKHTTSNFNGYTAGFNFRFSFNEKTNKPVINSKDILPYDEIEFTKENHVWRSKSTFKSCRILVIDIDEGYNSIIELHSKIKESSLKDCSFIYKTPSYDESKNKIKVRIGWLLEEEITDINELELYLSFLTSEFNGDKSCVDASRFYFPGKERVYVNEDIIFKKEQFNFYSSELVLNDEINTNDLIIEEVDIKSNIQNKSDFIEVLKYQLFYSFQDNKIVNFNWEENIETQWEFTTFNTTHLKYKNLFAFALNLNMIKGGLKWLKEQMFLNNEKGISHYDEIDFNILYYIKKYNYIPQSISFFDRCANEKEFMTVSIRDRKPTVSLEEGVKQMYFYFYDKILKDNERSKNILKVATGVGKTHMLSELKIERCIIAVATHKVKDELYERMKYKDDYVVTPQRPIFEDNELNEKLLYFDSVGDMRNSSIYMSEYIKQDNSNQTDVDAIRQYKMQFKECFTTTKNILTTHHSSFLFTDKNHDIIIYDEDPFKTMFISNKLIGKDLKRLYENDLFKPYIEPIINDIKTNPNQLGYRYNIDIDLELIENELRNNKIYNSNILSFFKCKYLTFIPNSDDIEFDIFNRWITYSGINEFPTNMKIVILSATAIFENYKAKYGTNMNLYEVDEIELKGKIIQDNRYKVFRNSLKNPKVVNHICNEMNQELSTLTFMDEKHLFKNSVPDMHFGNLLGYDGLKGTDINVAGTFLKPTWFYISIYNNLYPDVPIDNYNFGKRKVEYNGYRFTFLAFENEILRQIELDDINSEAIQATGRARLTRYKNTVYLFSGLPMENSTLKF